METVYLVHSPIDYNLNPPTQPVSEIEGFFILGLAIVTIWALGYMITSQILAKHAVTKKPRRKITY